jgi:hypothetical protein
MLYMRALLLLFIISVSGVRECMAVADVSALIRNTMHACKHSAAAVKSQLIVSELWCQLQV